MNLRSRQRNAGLQKGEKYFRRAGLYQGRHFGSKSGYRKRNPTHVFIPNAHVYCRPHGRVWWGDLDLKRDQPALEKAARFIRCRLYVVREHDSRPREPELLHAMVLRKAIWQTGGRTRIPQLTFFFRRSGLLPAQLALISKIDRSLFEKKLPPEVALKAYRRLVYFDQVFAEIGQELGLRKWGRWWTRPHKKLKGLSPIEALALWQTLDFGKLLKPKLAFLCIGLCWELDSVIEMRVCAKTATRGANIP